jgi:type I restriction enzyme S subunit
LYSFLSLLDLSPLDSGSTLPSMTQGSYNNIKVFLPNYNIQKNVSQFLKRIDAKIEVNNKINQELEAMAKTLYDYWFVQFDFPNANGKPYKSSGGKMVFNEELKREIPEGWEVKELDKIAEIKRGKLVTAKTAVLEGKFKVVSAGIDYSYLHSEYNREKNTITVSGSGANAGYINFWREPIFANDCTTVRGKTDEATLVILQFLKLRQDYILNQARGSAQPHVYPNDLAILKIEIPDNDLYKIYGKKIMPYNDIIANNLQQNQKLSELRDWLLPMLMNGQVSISEGYGPVERELGMVAEPNLSYRKEVSLPDLFPDIDLYSEVACLIMIEQEMNRRGRGKTWIQKTANHVKEIKKDVRLKDIEFEEYPWGMFSKTIAQAINGNPYLTQASWGDAGVFKIKSNKIVYLKQWMQEPRNAEFVAATRDIVSLYNDPLINSDLDRIELLNTVYRCVQKLNTYDFDIIYQEMRKWPMKEQGYANKAEKFKPYETKFMIKLVEKLVK